MKGREQARLRKGFTLVEAIVAIVIVSILAVGLGSAMLIASRALGVSRGPAADLPESAEALQRITNDLAFATSFGERTATAVTFSVPDRDGDGRSETIRYAWSGTIGDPLTYRYNNGAEVTLMDNVADLNFQYLTKTLPGR